MTPEAPSDTKLARYIFVGFAQQSWSLRSRGDTPERVVERECQMDLPIYSRESASVRQFITFWADQYPRKEMEQDDKRYTPHIAKPLTRESLETLYEWKNQTPLSKKKTLSVSENYIAHLDLLQKLPRQTAP